MKTHATPVLALAALAGLQACADPGAAPLGSIGATSASFSQTAAPARHLLALHGGGSAETLQARAAAAGGTLEWYHAGAGIAVVSGLTDAAAAALPGVALAEPDAELQLVPVAAPEVDGGEGVLIGDATPESQADPTTAFFYPRQWHLPATGANLAWAAGRLGSPAVSVFILDTGIDYTYPDLNGLVDLSRSVSFVPSDDALVQANFPGRHPVSDLHYHGTHVASIVSSKASVVAGVTSRVTLVGVKVLGVSGNGTTSGVLRGILYAADNGADVINLSLGSLYPKNGSGQFSSLVNQAANYAYRQGSLVVGSAGNEARDLSHSGNLRKLYCEVPHVVCVASTGPTASGGVNGPFFNVDALASYSNYGAPITVAAPGGANRPVWGACSQTSLALPICRTGIFTVGLNGTSQAAPHTSAIAALLVEELGPDRPAQVRHRIQATADDLGKPGQDPIYGSGRINTARAAGAI